MTNCLEKPSGSCILILDIQETKRRTRETRDLEVTSERKFELDTILIQGGILGN